MSETGDEIADEIIRNQRETITDLWDMIDKYQDLLAAKEEMIQSLCSGRSRSLGLGSLELGSASSTGGDGSSA